MRLLPLVAAFAAGVSAAWARKHKLVATAHVHSPKGANHEHIRAHFHFEGYTDGRPTKVKVHVLQGLKPTEELGGTNGFGYHIHTNPIPEDGDCSKALAHLDPYEVTESIICDPAFPQYCQEGDLSGKHGKLNGTAPHGAIPRFKYTDGYLRFFPEEASILGRSIVIHAANKTRLACGNIVSRLDGTAGFLGKPTGKPSDFVTKYPTVAPPNPPPTITPLLGTKFPTPAELEKFAHPLPLPATPLAEAVNIKLTKVTRTVKFTPEGATAPVQKTIESIKDEKADGTGPFDGKLKRRKAAGRR